MLKTDIGFEKSFSKFKPTKKSKGVESEKTLKEIAHYFYTQGQESKTSELENIIFNKQYEIDRLLNAPKEYAFTYECDHCGNEIENWTLDITGEKGIKIPTYNLAQTSFDCPKCGAEFGTGDIDVVEFSGPDRDYSEENEDNEDD